MKKVLLLVLPIILLAVPSDWEKVRTWTQPDGYTFEAKLIGDEHFHFFEDADGYVMVRDADGWFSYAQRQNGLLLSSEFLVGKSQPPFGRRLRPSEEAIARMPENEFKEINKWAENSRLRTERYNQLKSRDLNDQKIGEIMGLYGQNALICLLAAFSDSSFGWNQAGQTPPSALERRHFMGLAFGDSVPPYSPDSTVYSMNNFFFEASYGQLRWMGDVDSIRVTASSRAQANSATTTYISNACTAANPYVNFALYDLDGDGDVDQLFVIHPGYGEEESGNTADIWSASYTGSFGTYDGKLVNRAVVVPENAKLGVFCHELFHQYANGPDLYDYGYQGSPMGDYCLMDGGSWNGDPGGSRPSHMCGHLKFDCDGTWGGAGGYLGAAAVADTTEIRTNGKYFITQLDSQPGSALNYPRFYILMNQAFIDSSRQKFEVENRQRTGPYESYLPSSGLIISHFDRRGIGGRYNNGPPGYYYYTMLIEVAGEDPNYYYYLDNAVSDTLIPFYRNMIAAPFAADYGRIIFDSTQVCNNGHNKYQNTNPPSRFGPSIRGISNSGYNMFFTLGSMQNTPAPTTPALALFSFSIKDPITTGTNNDNNGVANCGEIDTLKLRFFNSGTSAVTPQESLTTTSPYVTILNPGRKNLAPSPIPATNGVGTDSTNPNVILIAANTPPNYIASFKIYLWATGYADSGVVSLNLNPVNIVWKFAPQSLTHPLFLPMAIDVYHDTLFLSDGDSLPGDYATNGSWRIFKFPPPYTSVTNYLNPSPGHSYLGAVDHKANGYLYWSMGDSCIVTNRIGVAQKRFMYGTNCSWANLRRVRGVTFAPTNTPTNFGPDSIFVYWQNYNTPGYTPFYEETLFAVRDVASGTSTYWWRQVIPEGQSVGEQNHWRNGRGLEHDGWHFWSTCIFDFGILMRRAPTSASTPADTIRRIENPSVWGSYAGYDIAFQAENMAGNEPHTPYGRGNRFYLYTTNIDDRNVYKVDVSSIVLPSPSENVTATRVSPSTVKVKWNNKCYSADPDTIEHVTGYVVYRTTSTNLIGDSVGYVTASGSGVAADSFLDPLPGMVETDYWYRVSSVNWFGFIPGHSISAGPIVGVEENAGNVQHRNLFYDIAPSITGKRLALRYEVAQECKVTLKVYSTLGALIRTVAARKVVPGKYTTIWNLNDNQNRRVANGVYFVKFETDQGYDRTQKLILNK